MSAVAARTRAVAVGAVAATAYGAAAGALWLQPSVLELVGKATFDELVNYLGFGTAFLGLPAVGALLTVRRPENPVGRCLLALGAGIYALLLVGAVTELAVLRGRPVEGVLLTVAALVGAGSPVLLALAVHLVLYFPEGRLDGPARWLSRVCLALTALVVIARLVRPAALDVLVPVPNRFARPWGAPLGDLVGPLTVAVVAVGVVALGRLALRYRHGDEVERAQFRWIVAALLTIPTFLALGIVLQGLGGPERLVTLVIIGGYNLGLLGFSAALLRAVTRRDLFGIGRVVSRSVTYLVLSLVLAGLYLGLVLGLGAVVRALTGAADDLVVALSTLTVAAVFQPLRRHVRSRVDRRFDRATYDAALTVDAFGRRLREEVDVDVIAPRLTAVAARTFRPETASVLLVRSPGSRT